MRAEATCNEWKQLYELAVRFQEQKPWEWLTSKDLLAISFFLQNKAETAYLSISGIIFRFKHYHVLSRIYAFSNSLHQCIITHYYALSFQNSLQFCCKNSFLLHEPTQGLFPKIHRIFVLNSSLIPFFSYLSLRHIYPSWFLCSHVP